MSKFALILVSTFYDQLYFHFEYILEKLCKQNLFMTIYISVAQEVSQFRIFENSPAFK